MKEYIFEDVCNRIDELMHYGTPRHSGRYPWGSGDNPYQHSGDFLSRVNELHKQGLSEKEIAETMGMSTGRLRSLKKIAKNERRSAEVAECKRLREEGYSTAKIAEMVGRSESTVRSLLNPVSEANMDKAMKTAEFLKQQVAEKGMIDVSVGIERELGISKEKMKEAIEILKEEGYKEYPGRIPQVTNPGKYTTEKVLCPPGTEYKEIYDYDKVHTITNYISRDGGETFESFVYPKSMDSKRLQIRYAEDGGIEKDGVIEIRRGVDDLSLGNSHYAQVRILVDDSKFLKGMAVYSDDMPDGVDVIFNTNKKKGTPTGDVLKTIKDDPDNPFGSLIKAGGQSYYVDKNGKKQLSLINKRAEEGDWGEWSNKLPSQFLAKQNMKLINKQLDLAKADKLAEFDEICSLTNPTVKKHLLQSFADDCDAAAVHLKAAALPRQSYQVILPITSMKDTEVYAPNYRNGEQVALIRYPHGGTFEIPILKVNNKHADAVRILGKTPKDAVGINNKVAERLSGADFDGDTVMVIPVGKNKISSKPPLEGLKDFDPKTSYPEVKGMKYMTKGATQTEMGKISNLITDMTLKGANDTELARAVRHSMVVIDAEKHKLNYKQSEIDNGIPALKKKYQGRIDEDGKYHEGASTLISRAKSETQVPKTKGSAQINKDTGEVSYKLANETYTDPRTGKVKIRTQTSKKMSQTKDAYTLVSEANTPQERAYADYANRMKALANQARKEMVSTKEFTRNSSAAAAYKKEVSDLKAKINIAALNAPKERAAQRIANSVVKAKKQSNPDINKKEIKKISQQALTAARIKVGAKRTPVKVTDKEWEAIQAGAITKTMLNDIIKYADIDDIKQKAMPRTTTSLSEAKVNKINSMRNSGYTTREIADALGVSSSTVSKYLN